MCVFMCVCVCVCALCVCPVCVCRQTIGVMLHSGAAVEAAVELIACLLLSAQVEASDLASNCACVRTTSSTSHLEVLRCDEIFQGSHWQAF